MLPLCGASGRNIRCCQTSVNFDLDSDDPHGNSLSWLVNRPRRGPDWVQRKTALSDAKVVVVGRELKPAAATIAHYGLFAPQERPFDPEVVYLEMIRSLQAHHAIMATALDGVLPSGGAVLNLGIGEGSTVSRTHTSRRPWSRPARRCGPGPRRPSSPERRRTPSSSKLEPQDSGR